MGQTIQVQMAGADLHRCGNDASDESMISLDETCLLVANPDRPCAVVAASGLNRSGSMAATFRLAMASDADSIEDRNALSPWRLCHRDVSRGIPRPTMLSLSMVHLVKVCIFVITLCNT
jgi:hypothetical protein